MCGINGLVLKHKVSKESLLEKINLMNELIYHRGPDEDGIFTETNSSNGIGIGMRRLSIIDLKTGKQPIYADDDNLVIVFNGEIYNYLELRLQLVEKGFQFSTHSDTEVILKLYEAEGADSFSKLDGMFAFSIYDKRVNKIFIARDYFGEKPLYYTNNETGFLWGSELKSIVSQLPKKPTISKLGLNHFLRLSYIPAPYSIYENIHKLPPNHCLVYDIASHSFEINPIPEEKFIPYPDLSFDEAKTKTKELLVESVESRAVSDVPLGTFLSGGVDSSIISLCLSRVTNSKINTFSIGFKKSSFDESDKARTVAKLIDSNHHEFIIEEDDLKDNITDILLNFDEPFSDIAALPTYLVSKKTREHLKVALTGDGGDEVFGGYNKYYIGKLNNTYTSIIPRKLHNLLTKATAPLLITKEDKRGWRFKIKKMLQSINYDGGYYWDIISLGNTETQLSEILLNQYLKINHLKEYQDNLNMIEPKGLTDFRHVDKMLSLEGGMLPKVDRTSMLTSLECRAPFLNKKIWHFTNSLPESYLLNGWSKKHILKKAFEEEFPKGFLQKSKQGFEAPVGDWLRSTLKNELKSYIDHSFLSKQEIFNIPAVYKLVNDHIEGKEDNTYRVWNYYCFQKWYCQIYNIIS